MAGGSLASTVPNLDGILTLEVDPNINPVVMEAFLEQNPIGRKLSFAFLDFEAGISENAPPQYADTDVVGRAEQYKTYVGTANREYNLTFKFQAQGLGQNAGTPTASRDAAKNAGNGPEGNRAAAKVTRTALATILEQEVVNPALWLDALQQPVVTPDGLSHAPPPVLVTVGRLIPTSRCIVLAAPPTWLQPFDPETLLPFAAEVGVTLTVVRKNIKSNIFKHRRSYGSGV
jgi:hypothetical protein